MEYKAPERYILHLHGKSSEEVKLFIDDTWSKMVSFQEQRLKLCEQSTFFAISLPKMIPSPFDRQGQIEKFGGCEVISVVN